MQRDTSHAPRCLSGVLDSRISFVLYKSDSRLLPGSPTSWNSKIWAASGDSVYVNLKLSPSEHAEVFLKQTESFNSLSGFLPTSAPAFETAL